MGAKVRSLRDLIDYFAMNSFSSSSLAATLAILYVTITVVVFSSVCTSFM